MRGLGPEPLNERGCTLLGQWEFITFPKIGVIMQLDKL